MRFLFIVVTLLTILSIEQSFIHADLEEDMRAEPTWARTYPVRTPASPKTRPPPVPIQRNTTTALVRVSDGVTIGVSIALFVVTLGVGFLLLYLVIQGFFRKNQIRVGRLGP